MKSCLLRVGKFYDIIPFSTLKSMKRVDIQHKYLDSRLFCRIKLLYMNHRIFMKVNSLFDYMSV